MDKFRRIWATKNPNDEWWSSFVTSPLAVLINCVVIEWKFLTPNRITSLSFLVSLTAVFLIVTGSYTAFVIAAILINFSHVLDCMDGQMAKFRGITSPFGSYYDKLTDQLKVFLFFFSIAYSYYLNHDEPLMGLTHPVVLIFVSFTGVSFYYIRSYVKYLTMFIEIENNPNFLIDSSNVAKNIQDKNQRLVAGIGAGFKCNFIWFLKEQKKFLLFNEGVFIFMLSFGLIFEQIPFILWVFAISQIYFGIRRSWQRGAQIIRGQHEDLLKPIER